MPYWFPQNSKQHIIVGLNFMLYTLRTVCLYNLADSIGPYTHILEELLFACLLLFTFRLSAPLFLSFLFLAAFCLFSTWWKARGCGYRVSGKLPCGLDNKEQASQLLFGVLLFWQKKRTQLFLLAEACLVYRVRWGVGEGIKEEEWGLLKSPVPLEIWCLVVATKDGGPCVGFGELATRMLP